MDDNEQIKCSHCGEALTIDDDTFNSIATQIRNIDFKEQLKKAKNLSKLQVSKLHEVRKTHAIRKGEVVEHYEVSIGPHDRYLIATDDWKNYIFSNYKDKGIVAISSDIKDLTDQERLYRADKLGDFIQSKGFGYYQLFGGYTYKSGCKNYIAFDKLSFLVPLNTSKTEKDLYNLALEAGEKFGQKYVSVWLPSYQEGKPHWIGTNKANSYSYHKATKTFKVDDSMAFVFKRSYDVMCYRIPCSQYQGYKFGKIKIQLKEKQYEI